MSKTTVRKSLEEFNAPQLRQLILDLYAKSKEAKEILDFYASPDIAKKIDEYKKPIEKEVWRYTRHAFHPRVIRIRSLLKKFRVLEPGDVAIGELMAFTIFELCKVGSRDTLADTTNHSINKFFDETLIFLDSRRMIDEYAPRFAKAIREMKDFTYFHNPLKQQLSYTLAHYKDV